MGNPAQYTLDNAAEQAGTRFVNLESLFDPVTIRHIEALDLRPGAHCWEVGAGNGSIAGYLAGRVGPTGRVLATDLNPRWVAAGDPAVLEIRGHDVASDPLPDGTFDLIHARLVIIHLTDPAAAIKRLTKALKPGGRLLIEDFDLRQTGWVDPAHPEVGDVLNAFVALLLKNGVNASYGQNLPSLFRQLGLVEVAAEGYAAVGLGDSAVGALNRANIEQTRAGLVASGLVTDEEIERFYEQLADPDLVVQMPVLISATGTRPS
jgi:SAM-dependent methyltransferase